MDDILKEDNKKEKSDNCKILHNPDKVLQRLKSSNDNSQIPITSNSKFQGRDTTDKKLNRIDHNLNEIRNTMNTMNGMATKQDLMEMKKEIIQAMKQILLQSNE